MTDNKWTDNINIDTKNTNMFGIYESPRLDQQEFQIGDIVQFHDTSMGCPRMMVIYKDQASVTVTWFGYQESMYNHLTETTRQSLRLPSRCFRLVSRVGG